MGREYGRSVKGLTVNIPTASLSSDILEDINNLMHNKSEMLEVIEYIYDMLDYILSSWKYNGLMGTYDNIAAFGIYRMNICKYHDNCVPESTMLKESHNYTMFIIDYLNDICTQLNIAKIEDYTLKNNSIIARVILK